MKKFATSFLAAVLGSAMTLMTVYFVSTKDETPQPKTESQTMTPARAAGMNLNGNLEIPDFTSAAEVAMPAVVHIKSITVRGTNRRYRDPFRDFFGDDLFQQFFGPGGGFPSRPQAQVSTGSGVIINEDGFIITNNHVINGAEKVEVALQDNRVYEAEIVGTDPSTDLAVLKINASSLPTVPLVNSDDVRVGEWVLAVGNPFNLNSTVTAGIVSAKARSINILKGKGAIEAFIQTDAAINPGNSGGALVNLKGELIGINTAIASPTGAYSGYGFAVPSNIVKKVVEDLMKYGTVQRAYLGVNMRNVDAALAEAKGLDVTQGVYVDGLSQTGAGAMAGLEAGDVIVGAEGHQVNSLPELLEVLGRKSPGDQVTLSVNRGGKIKTIKAMLSNRNGTTKRITWNEDEVLELLGVKLNPLTKEEANALRIRGGLKITQLNNGKLRQYTDVQPGFIITRIDGKAITSMDNLINALRNKQGGVMMEGIYEGYTGVYYYAFGM